MRVEARQGQPVLRRVCAFCKAGDLQPVIGPVEKPVEELEGLLGRLSGHVVEQAANEAAFQSLSLTARKQSRDIVLKFMRPIERLTKALFPSDLALQKAMQLPESRAYESVIAGALSMAERAVEHQARFVEAGFSADFIERLKTAADSLRKVLDAKAVYRGRRSAATAGIVAEYRRGRHMVRLLDALVAPALEGMPDRLAEWRTLSRFVRATPAGEGAVAPVTVPGSGEASTGTQERDHAA